MSIEAKVDDPALSVINGATMGTRYSATFLAPPNTDLSDLDAALFAAVDRVDAQMSTWKPRSDLMRLNGAPVGQWVEIPRELMRVLGCALDIGRVTNGAFDIALGDLTNVWGFGAVGQMPDALAIKTRLGKVQTPAFEAVELDSEGLRARRLEPVQLDLSGIAKGFGVDEMMRCLHGFGIKNALVSLDGELRASGQKTADAPWSVAIEKPDYANRAPLGVIALEDAAIATSGDYRHWIDVGDIRLSHTMDRQSGGPLKNRVASVSVIAESCMEADAWATALMVMGDVAGPALARAKGLQALFVTRDRDGIGEIPVGQVFCSP